MATKTVPYKSQIKLTRPASAKLVGLLKKPQTRAQRETSAQAKGTYSLYRDKWLSNK